MLETLVFAANAVLPIVLIIILGYYLKKLKFIDAHFVNLLNKYVFRIGLPILLFINIYSIESFKDINWNIIIFAVSAILILFIIALLTINLSVKDPRQKGVLLQNVVRSNFALIGFPLGEALGGPEALVIVALLSAFTIPLSNILSVISLTMYQVNEDGQKVSIKKMLTNVFTNPIIVSVFIGLFVLLIRGLITPSGGVAPFTIKGNLKFLYDAFKLVSVTASPMALIALGAQFELNVVRPLLKKIILGVTWRIILAPGLVLTAAYLLQDRISGLSTAFAALIALFGSPAAVSTAIMAREMGGDEQLAGQLVIWTSVFSIFSLMTIIIIFRSLGVL